MKELPLFKIRASQCSKIMSGNFGASKSQLENIAKMEAREKPMTPAMQEKYDKDIAARDNPKLPKGAQTYCQQWLKENFLYNRRKEIKSKYLTKGNECEDSAIHLLNIIHLKDYVKNEEYFENDFITGTPDIIDKPLNRDTKCSWDSDTFPLFETWCDDSYKWQGQCYMDLTGSTSHSVDYCLIDTPEHLIRSESKRESWSSYKTEEEIYEELREKMTYGDIDPLLRVKSFYFNKNQDEINSIYERVKLCRVYINELVSKLKEEGRL